MSIPIRFYTAVLKKSAIRAQYPGGLDHFVKDRPPGIPEDDELIGVPFMSGGALQQFQDMLIAVGFDLKQGYAVGEMTLGELDPCPGIAFRAINEKNVVNPSFFAYSYEVPASSGTSELAKNTRITRLKIGSTKVPARVGPTGAEETDEYNYWAEAIEEGGRFYYRVAGITIEISAEQFRNVVTNPRLYYFSTALKLHHSIKTFRQNTTCLPSPPSSPTYINDPNARTTTYPHLVVRIYSAVYQKEPLHIREGPSLVAINHGTSYVQHPNPYVNGALSEDCRNLLLTGVQEAVRRFKHRICVVWSPTACSYVEPNEINHSDDPPSGGIVLPNPIEFSKRIKWNL